MQIGVGNYTVSDFRAKHNCAATCEKVSSRIIQTVKVQISQRRYTVWSGTSLYSKTCVRQPPLKLTLVIDVKRWLSYKGTCHVILLAKLHDMYLYKTNNFFHNNHYLKSVSKVALLHRFYCTSWCSTVFWFFKRTVKVLIRLRGCAGW